MVLAGKDAMDSLIQDPPEKPPHPTAVRIGTMRKRSGLIGGIPVTCMAMVPGFRATQAAVDSPLPAGWGETFPDNAVLQQLIKKTAFHPLLSVGSEDGSEMV